MDLNALSLEDLKTLRKDVEKAIGSFEKRRLKDARTKLEAYAREIGVELNEVMDIKPGAKSVNPPKYRHPKDPNMTWTGRGRKPKWIVEALERGKSLKSFEI
jgi:DNA-binding protein H-NS